MSAATCSFPRCARVCVEDTRQCHETLSRSAIMCFWVLKAIESIRVSCILRAVWADSNFHLPLWFLIAAVWFSFVFQPDWPAEIPPSPTPPTARLRAFQAPLCERLIGSLAYGKVNSVAIFFQVHLPVYINRSLLQTVSHSYCTVNTVNGSDRTEWLVTVWLTNIL